MPPSISIEEFTTSINCLKSDIAAALIGGNDPAEIRHTQQHLQTLSAVGSAIATADPKKLSFCIEAIENPQSFRGTNRKIVLARAQRFLTSLSIELGEIRTVSQKKSPPSPKSDRPSNADAGFDDALLKLKGIGAKTAAKLASHGITSPVEILFCLPRRYDDRRAVTPIAQLQPGMRVVTEGSIEKVAVFGRPWKRIMQVEISDGKDSIVGMWFSNRRPSSASFVKGKKLKMAGLVGNYKNSFQIAHPSVAFEGEPSNAMGRIIPVYPEIPGVPGATIEKAIHSALSCVCDYIEESIPIELVQKHGLISLQEALTLAHIPPLDVDIQKLDAWVNGSSPAHRRLAYDEFLFIQLALGLRKRSECKIGAPKIPSSDELATRTGGLLGFYPTSAQNRVIAEIQSDMDDVYPMRRLLQGDVGSGKTMVALSAIIACVEAGYQATLMAPTEILAEQHMRTLYPVLKKMGIHCALHMGNARSSTRKKFIEQTKTGIVQVAIGTHALISESVEFADLALAIVDEQHRFGVSQRLGLQGKASSDKAPHLLVMTATPIPRSLALTVHGDLDISVLDQLPPGRTTITTEYIASNDREAALSYVDDALARNEQVYVVCPIIDQSETLEVSDVNSTFDFYQERYGSSKVGLLHGRLSCEQRDEVMNQFLEQELGILVCTTVIEVGVDIPNATIMIIEGCERFGLAQLHQLRGRVGRSELPSTCLLLGDPTTIESEMRIETIVSSNDGFAIAEQDLQIRGPGQLYGKKQAGLPGFKFGDLKRDLDLLIAARQDAQDVLTESPTLAHGEYAKLGKELKRRILAGDGPIGEESG